MKGGQKDVPRSLREGNVARSRAPRPPRAPGRLRRLRDSGHYGADKAAPLGTADKTGFIGRGPAVTPLAAKCSG